MFKVIKNAVDFMVKYMIEYSDFAKVYDELMDNVPYEKWCKYIVSLLKEYGIEDGLVTDLGCGSGTLTELLSKKGFDMIGIDLSTDMLDIARNKSIANNSNTLYLNQDMREFELYGTVKAIISTCDSMNYILDSDELIHVFKLVNNYLDPKGIFIFDLNTDYKYKSIGECVIAENRDDCSFIWENYYDEEEFINEYDLTLFLKCKNEKDENLFEKHFERHTQRAYSLDEIKDFLTLAGMEFLCAYDAFTKDAVKDTSERICIIARECGK